MTHTTLSASVAALWYAIDHSAYTTDIVSSTFWSDNKYDYVTVNADKNTNSFMNNNYDTNSAGGG
jgi:hypothetical protein